VLTEGQHDEFRATGLLRLGGPFPQAAAEAMCGRLWEFLASQYAIHYGERSTWTVEHPARFQPVTHSGAFRVVGGGPLCAALDALLGPGQWAHPRWWGRPLVTFPQDGPWELPTRAWHFDCMPVSAGRRPVQFFALPHLGLGEAFRLDRVRTSLAAHPWLRGLWEPGDDGDRVQRYMNDRTIIDGVPLRVVELTGEPGDVILMHSDSFHAAAPNRLTEPRMMLTEMVSPNRSQQ
jgi:hypothetical protein